MTHDEYEKRKRRLEEEHRAGVELLDTAYRQQLRALEIVWVLTSGDPRQLPAIALASTLTAAAPSATAAPAAQRRKRRGAWELLNEVAAALARVPEVFDRNDICRALGYKPDRGSLSRAFQDLVAEGAISVETTGRGNQPGTFRKKPAPSPPPEA